MFSAIPDKEPPAPSGALRETPSPFVLLTAGSGLDVCMQYPRLGMHQAVERCFVRREVYDRLLQAQAFLPEGFRLRVWDAWRPLALQRELYDTLSQRILSHFGLTDAPREQQLHLLQQYVSLPSTNRQDPPLHTTGGAVDVTLLDSRGRELDMGTPFDDFTAPSATAYLESHPGNETARDNRRMLYHCMRRAGFENLPSEWWHYDYGDRVWGYYRRCPALYGGIYDIKEITDT